MMGFALITRVSLFFFCISISASASEIALCTKLLGPFQDLLPNESLPLDINQPVDKGGPRFSDLFRRLGFNEVADAVENLNASNNSYQITSEHENLIRVVGKHLEPSGLQLSAQMRNSHSHSVAIARPVGGSEPHAFRELIEKLSRLKVDVVLNTHTFRDDAKFTARFDSNEKLFSLNDGGFRVEPRMVLTPSSLQWFSDRIVPTTVHEIVHLAFVLQKQADIRGESKKKHLPPSLGIHYYSDSAQRVEALKGYASSHVLDEFDAFLAGALIHIAVVRSSLKDSDAVSESVEKFINLVSHLLYADYYSSMAFGLYRYDRAALEESIASLQNNDLFLALSSVKGHEYSSLNTGPHRIGFSNSQIEFRMGRPIPYYANSSEIRNDLGTREQMVRLFQRQLDHYRALMPVLDFARSSTSTLREGFVSK